MKTLGERDHGVPEAIHHIFSIKLHSSLYDWQHNIEQDTPKNNINNHTFQIVDVNNFSEMQKHACDIVKTPHEVCSPNKDPLTLLVIGGGWYRKKLPN